MMRSLLVLALMPAVAYSADPVGPPPRMMRVSTPQDAHNWAWQDVQTIDPVVARFTRYIRVSDGKPESAKLVALTLNYISRARIPRRPVAVAKGQLVRVDLRQLVDFGEEADLAEMGSLWEDFRFDPYFNTIITRGSIESALRLGLRPGVVEVGRTKLLINTDAYTDVDGVERTQRWVSAVSLPGVHMDQKVYQSLQQATGSRAPVVDDRYFTFRALSTIKNAKEGDSVKAAKIGGVFSEVLGGRYYEFANLTRKGKGTALARLFESLGVGDVNKDLTAETLYARAKSEQRVAMFRSRVTEKPRLIAFFPTLAARFGDGQAWIIVTFDIADEDVDVDEHAIMNLLNFKKFKALEVIWRMPNNLHGFALFDAAGDLQDFAPPNVVKDSQIPGAHTNLLSGAISCIRCHGYDGSDGLKPAPNDVQAFRRKYKGAPDIFGDLSEKRDPFATALDKAAGLFAGAIDGGLATGRRDYSKGILAITGPYKEDAAEAQVNIGKVTANGYKSMWNAWRYTPVTPRAALLDAGYDVGPKDAVELLRELLKPPDGGGAVRIEDARTAGLVLDIEGGITPNDFLFQYSFMAARIKANEARLAKEKKP
jgi:hypothetical protein